MEVENKVPETENTQTQNNTTTPTTPLETETQDQIHWRKFRESREIERKQRLDAEKRAQEKEAEAQALKAAMESLLSKSPPAANQIEPQGDITQEQYIAGLVKLELQKAQRQHDEERKQREQQEFPQKLTQTYQDFNQICTPDNLDYLEYHYPEIANAFGHMPEGFDKWSTIYKAVKRLMPGADSKKDQSKAEKNFNKPQAMSIAGKTQVGDTAPQQLDEKRRMDNWARMQRVMKGGGA